jgi:hypothetical protein
VLLFVEYQHLCDCNCATSLQAGVFVVLEVLQMGSICRSVCLRSSFPQSQYQEMMESLHQERELRAAKGQRVVSSIGHRMEWLHLQRCLVKFKAAKIRELRIPSEIASACCPPVLWTRFNT